ncbi:helix-turn-helix domain-containing protein [Novosphingobium percolationis]|uniref:helix-turn-helix domain-containing protein n=1 Tax=Novosphingobium percolationis TaxID=2871811 RepID=UPI001CD42506|nr:helix-turn-helix domain-containing protein [Novosphingobium percolationis]
MNTVTHYKVDQAIDLLNISRSTFYKAVREDRIAVTKIGRCTRVCAKELERFAADAKVVN